MSWLRRFMACCALAFALASCSHDKPPVDSNPKAALAVAAKRTADAGTAKITLDATSGKLNILGGTGAYDFKHSSGRFKLSGQLISSIELVITADTVYVRTPNGEKPWAALTDADLDRAGSGAIVSALRAQVDPRETLRNLGRTTKNVKVVGSEEVRNAKTTHIHADVDLSDAAIAKAPAAEQDSLRKTRESIGAPSYPIDVWLDDGGRVRRMSYALSVGTGQQRATTTVLLELFDFGKDPGIVIPDSADVKSGVS